MQVFHGSNTKIEKIDLAKCEHFKDFGRGFYVTKIKKHAEAWAVEKAKWLKNGEPVVTEFSYYEHYPENAGLSVKRFPDLSEEWVKFIIMNRDVNALHPAHNFDIVEGPIADDKMVVQIQQYFLEKITIATLIKRLTYREPTHQICFCTVRSLYALGITDDKHFPLALDEISTEITERIMGDSNVTEQEATDIFLASATYARLADTNSLLWQRPWQEVYDMFMEESAAAR
jgi:hypothetical protein